MDIHFYIEGIEHTKSVVVADSSYRYQEVMGEHSVTLNFDLPEYFDFIVGSWILYENVKYRLFDIPEKNGKQNERYFEYTLVFKDPTEWMTRFKLRNTVDGRLAFTITAQPFEFVDLIVDNLNARDTGVIWRRGDCIESAEKTQSFSHNCVRDGLNSVAQLFETEYEAKLASIDAQTGKQIYDINLKKVEYNKLTAATNNAQRLEYGKGNGFLPGIVKTKGEGNAVDVVWVEGGDRNIDSQTYTYQKNVYEDGHQRIETFHANKLRLPRAISAYYIPPTSDTDKGTVYNATEWGNLVGTMSESEMLQFRAENKVQQYFTDSDGFGLHRRTSEYVNNGYEESIDLTDIYPCQKLNITDVMLKDYTGVDNPDPAKYSNRFWNIMASANTVDYNRYIIGGEEPTVVFNTGMLAGKEFNLANQQSDANPKIYDTDTHEFYIQPTEIDGITMPDLPIDVQDKDNKYGTGYIPAVGDEFAVFHVALPQEYIDKAEKELLLEACHYLYIHGEVEVQFSCSLDGIFSRNKWETLRQYFVVGGYINFIDKDFCQDGRLLRILSVKDYINRPHAPELTLSNSTVSQSVSSELKKVAQNQVFQTENYSSAIQFAKRNFRAAEQAQKKIAEAYGEDMKFVSDDLTAQIQEVINNLNMTQTHFTESINPVTIQTMSLLIGDKNLQFCFGHATTDEHGKVTEWQRMTYEPQWNGASLTCPGSIDTPGGTVDAHVRHDYYIKGYAETKNGITAVTADDYPYWKVAGAVLSSDGDGQPLDAGSAYFLYLQCPSGAMSDGYGYLQYDAHFVLYPEAHPHSGDDFYFLVGILNAEFNGQRSYVDIYSSVEITGGQIRADWLGDHDGDFYLDLINQIIKGNINIVDGAVAKEFILGKSKEDNLGGMTGRDVYFDENVANFYNRLVRFWLSNGSRLTERDGKLYLSGAKIVFFADGSYLFRDSGKNFYHDCSSEGSPIVMQHDVKITDAATVGRSLLVGTVLRFPENGSSENHTYVQSADANFCGRARTSVFVGGNGTVFDHSAEYSGVVPVVLWHGLVKPYNRESTDAEIYTYFSAHNFKGDAFSIRAFESRNVLSITLPDDVNRDRLHFNVVKWNGWLDEQRHHGYYNVYNDDIYSIGGVATTRGYNRIYIKYSWDGDDEQIKPFLFTIMYI